MRARVKIKLFFEKISYSQLKVFSLIFITNFISFDVVFSQREVLGTSTTGNILCEYVKSKPQNTNLQYYSYFLKSKKWGPSAIDKKLQKFKIEFDYYEERQIIWPDSDLVFGKHIFNVVSNFWGNILKSDLIFSEQTDDGQVCYQSLEGITYEYRGTKKPVLKVCWESSVELTKEDHLTNEITSNFTLRFYGADHSDGKISKLSVSPNLTIHMLCSSQ